MSLSCRVPARASTLLTRCVEKYLTHFHHTYINAALCDVDDGSKFWGQKIKVQGHGGKNVLDSAT